MNLWLKRALWISVGVGAILVIVRAFQPSPVLVDVATVATGRLRVTVDDDGHTRVRERYTISAPIRGRLLRANLDPGHPVRAGETVVAEFEAIAPDLLDARSRAEARARLSRAEAALSGARARKEQADANLDQAVADLARAGELQQQGIQSPAAYESAVRTERRAREGARAAEFAVQVSLFEVDVARASLREADATDVGAQDPPPAKHRNGGAGTTRVSARSGRLSMRSPIDGKVLRVFEESSRTLAVGDPILEVGNTEALEIVADYLSQDAVKVRPGMPVLISGWGGDDAQGDGTLRGRVRLAEPGGFTKVSALGVEEQRVNILVDPVGDAERWKVVGDGYRVELRIILWEQDEARIVPTGALFRRGDSWVVFVVEGAVARMRRVALGRRNGLEAQVLDGLEDGEQLVLYPSDLIGDGARVTAR